MLPNREGRPRPRPANPNNDAHSTAAASAEPARSHVSIWRPAGAKSRRFSIRVIAGDEELVPRLVEVALEAERRLQAGPSKAEEGGP